MVREVSAMLVETTTFLPMAPFGLFGGGDSKILCWRLGGSVEYNGMHLRSPTSGPRFSTSRWMRLHASSISWTRFLICNTHIKCQTTVDYFVLQLFCYLATSMYYINISRGRFLPGIRYREKFHHITKVVVRASHGGRIDDQAVCAWLPCL